MTEMTFYIIGGISLLASLAIRGWLNSAYKKWGSVENSRGVTGADTARLILSKNGLNDVGVEAVKGRLTDHYDPRSRTVRLSAGNYTADSVAALAVAGSGQIPGLVFGSIR